MDSKKCENSTVQLVIKQFKEIDIAKIKIKNKNENKNKIRFDEIRI